MRVKSNAVYIIIFLCFILSFVNIQFAEAQNTTTIEVPADKVIIPVRLKIDKGDRLEITSYGKWSLDGNEYFDADGKNKKGGKHFQLKGANIGALIGKINFNGDFLEIGKDFSKIIEKDGYLFLAINERKNLFVYPNNKGSITAEITVTSSSEPVEQEQPIPEVLNPKPEPKPWPKNLQNSKEPVRSFKPKPVARKPLTSKKGFIEVAPSKRYFQFEDGTPFFPVGHNDWPPEFDLRKKTVKEVEQYFKNLKEHDVNVIRIILDVGNKETSLWVEDPMGEINPEFKEWMDTILGLAEKYDVYLILALYPNLVDGFFGNWKFYPYSKSAGGKIERSYDMITDPVAKEAQKARFRYFVDTWGSSSNIFSWELFNEFWHPDKKKYRTERESLPDHNKWADEMGKYIKDYEMNVYGRYHLRSISTMRSEFPRNRISPDKTETNIYDSENLDFASFHTYGQMILGAMNSGSDFDIVAGKEITAKRLVRSIRKTVKHVLDRAPNRPVLSTEDFQIVNPKADGYNNPMNSLRKMLRGFSDAERYDLFNVANWAFIMSGAAGTTMRYPSGFYEDEMYNCYKVISEFAKRIPWQEFKAKPIHDKIKTDNDKVLPFALADNRRMITWFYHEVPFKQREAIQPTVTFSGLPSGSYNVHWINSKNAEEVKTEEVNKVPFTLKTPKFEGHIACYVERKSR